MMEIDGIISGHRISKKGIQVDPTKVKAILNFPTPTSQNKVWSFLGYIGYYRRFIEKISHISFLLFSLLSKDIEFVWTYTCQHVLEKLKIKVYEAPILQCSDWSLPFHISADALYIVVRSVLGQIEGKDPYAIYYVSKNLSSAELNYTVTKKEFLVVIHVINKFRNYITGYSVILHTEHASIKYLMNKPITNGRVIRWFLYYKNFILPF